MLNLKMNIESIETTKIDEMIDHITSHPKQVIETSLLDKEKELVLRNENQHVSTSGHSEITENTEENYLELDSDNAGSDNAELENEYSEGIETTKNVDNKDEAVPKRIRKKILKSIHSKHIKIKPIKIKKSTLTLIKSDA
ncbi:unnamed protein product, partial [Meganyctiphanes norvegica]